MTEESSPPSSRAHVFITGRVQGVSFRWYTQRQAQQLGLTGWVRNLWDGRVEAVFEGQTSAVRQMVAWCHRGDPPARVDSVDVTYGPVSGEFSGFRITY